MLGSTKILMTEKKTKKELKQVEHSEDNKTYSEHFIPDEILEAIPDEDRVKVAGIIRQTMISGVMRRSNPIADKITSDHITQLISKSDEQDIRDRTERKGERILQSYFDYILP